MEIDRRVLDRLVRFLVDRVTRLIVAVVRPVLGVGAEDITNEESRIKGAHTGMGWQASLPPAGVQVAWRVPVPCQGEHDDAAEVAIRTHERRRPRWDANASG